MFDILYTWLQFQSRAQCDFLQMCFFSVCARAPHCGLYIFCTICRIFCSPLHRAPLSCAALYSKTHTHTHTSLCEWCSLHWIKHNWMTHSRIAHTSLYGMVVTFYMTPSARFETTYRTAHIFSIICNINCYYTSVLMHLWARGCLKCARLWLSSFLFI